MSDDKKNIPESIPELDEMVKILYNENQTIKTLEENSKVLKNKIISGMENHKLNKYIVSDSESVQSNIKVSLVEKTSITYDMNFVKEIIPEAITKTLIVTPDRLESFKSTLKSFGLSGKQVSQLLKTMEVKTEVDSSLVKTKIDKGEISSEDVVKIADVHVISKYLKFS